MNSIDGRGHRNYLIKMKKFLAILVLGLLWSSKGYASQALCITHIGDYVTFDRTWFEKDCKGYALYKKANKKLYKRIIWLGVAKEGSGNNYGKPYNINSKVLVRHFWFITMNHWDPKWDQFVENVLGYSFVRKDYFRKNNSEELTSMQSDGSGNIIIGDIDTIDEAVLDKLLNSAKDFREGRITESEFDRIKDDIL